MKAISLRPHVSLIAGSDGDNINTPKGGISMARSKLFKALSPASASASGRSRSNSGSRSRSGSGSRSRSRS